LYTSPVICAPLKRQAMSGRTEGIRLKLKQVFSRPHVRLARSNIAEF